MPKIRSVMLTKFTYDRWSMVGSPRAEAALRQHNDEGHVSGELSIGATLSDALVAKIVFMIEQEIAETLGNAEPESTGVPPKPIDGD